MGYFELFASVLAGFYAIVKSYGLAIILLTLAVRVILLPLSIKQTKSMREMQRIGPELKKLQTKYKGDRQKLNEEMMKLYKEHGVNPFGGCLPMLMQFPIIIPLFWVVRTPLKYMGYTVIEGAPSIPDLAKYYRANPAVDGGIMETIQHSQFANDLLERWDAVNNFLGLHLDDTPLGVAANSIPRAIPYFLLVLLIGFTTYYQQKQIQGTRGAVQDQQSQQLQMMTRIMPLMIMVFSVNFPTGVVLYWLTTNIWTIAQQRIVLKAVPEVPRGASKPADKPRPKSSDGAKPSAGAEGKASRGGARPIARGGTRAAGRSGGNGSGSRSPSTRPQPSGRKKKKR